MASVSKNKAGLYTVQFYVGDGTRRSVRLGRVTKKVANDIRIKVEALHLATVHRLPMDSETANWVAGIGDELAGKLIAVGLIAKRTPAALLTWEGFLNQYVADRPHKAANTVRNYRQAGALLSDHFGPRTNIGDVTPHQADQWVTAMRKRYSTATVARLIKFAKQFYTAAIRAQYVTENPFRDIVAGSMANPDKIRFVTRDEIERVIEACPHGEWRLIVALARYAGLRCPSELVPLTWGDVDWARNRFMVRSSKTGRRLVPIFPELRPHLEAEFERAGPGAVQVVPMAANPFTNLRAAFELIIQRAGIVPWPRIFQNLRASRETELAATFPLHVVTAWLGNSPRVAVQHYLSVTEPDFERGATGGANVVRNPVPQTSVPLRRVADAPQDDVILDLKIEGELRNNVDGYATVRRDTKSNHYPQQESKER